MIFELTASNLCSFWHERSEGVELNHSRHIETIGRHIGYSLQHLCATYVVNKTGI